MHDLRELRREHRSLRDRFAWLSETVLRIHLYKLPIRPRVRQLVQRLAGEGGWTEAGQGWEIPIQLSHVQARAPDAATFLKRFEEDYTRLFGPPVAGLDVEITVWSVRASTPVEAVEPVRLMPAGKKAGESGRRGIVDPASGRLQDAVTVARSTMSPGEHVIGPGAVTEGETTIIVPVGSKAICQPDGCIDIQVKG